MLAPLAQSVNPMVYAIEATQPYDSLSFNGAQASVIGTMLFVAFLKLIDRLLPRFRKADNAIALVLGIIGITGGLALLPRFTSYRQGLLDAVSSGVAGGGLGQTGLYVVAGVFIVIGMYSFYSHPTFGTGVFLVLTASLMYISETMRGLAAMWLPWGTTLYDFFVGIFSYVMDITR